MIKNSFLLLLLALSLQSNAQTTAACTITVLNTNGQPAAGAVAELMQGNKLIKASLTGNAGNAVFDKLAAGVYSLTVSFAGHLQYKKDTLVINDANSSFKIQLQQSDVTLQAVSVTNKKPFIQQAQGKTIINTDAAVTNAGTTVLEVLEKSPGITVDRNGSIAMQGKAGVLVLIDDKQTYLSGAELNNLLSSMSSAQVELIELMPNPPAKYDAAGNAGIINIRTKKK